MGKNTLAIHDNAGIFREAHRESDMATSWVKVVRQGDLQPPQDYSNRCIISVTKALWS